MGRLFGQRSASLEATLDALGIEARGTTGTQGTPASAGDSMKHSGVWAAIRLRANLISTLPVDVFTKTGPLGSEVQTQVPGTRFFARPAAGMLWHEWMYATQSDLDRYGNTMGAIVARENGWPVQVELWSAPEVTVKGSGNLVTSYRYRGKTYAPENVWHERQYVAAGLPLGMSPIAHAAWSTGTYLSAQAFALSWFSNGAHPSGTLRNTEQAMLDQNLLTTAKAKFREATANRDIFVTGKEWEFSPATVDASTAQFLEQMTYGITDVARWFDVPASAIDGAPNGPSSQSYANVTQDNLQLLVRHLGPAITRRELSLSANALPAPRYVKLNSDALLRLDPQGRTDLMVKQIDAWILTPDEARALENRKPLTSEQVAQLAAHTKTPAAPQEAPK